MEDNKHVHIRVLELFSGIGGMHYALSQARDTLSREIFDFEVIAAMDISEVANKVYRHNFPQVNHIAGNICGLTADKVNKWEIDAIFMSPPCQVHVLSSGGNAGKFLEVALPPPQLKNIP